MLLVPFALTVVIAAVQARRIRRLSRLVDEQNAFIKTLINESIEYSTRAVAAEVALERVCGDREPAQWAN
jgi:hypothetical protein